MLLWHASDGARAPAALDTQHRANLFGVQFLPGSGDSKLVTGAMDFTVQLHELDTPPAAAPPEWRPPPGGGAARRHAGARVRRVTPRTTVFACHENRVKARRGEMVGDGGEMGGLGGMGRNGRV